MTMEEHNQMILDNLRVIELPVLKAYLSEYKQYNSTGDYDDLIKALKKEIYNRYKK